MSELAPNGLPQRLREGIDHHDGIVEAEAVMDAAADELDLLRAENERLTIALEQIRDMWPWDGMAVREVVNAALRKEE